MNRIVGNQFTSRGWCAVHDMIVKFNCRHDAGHAGGDSLLRKIGWFRSAFQDDRKLAFDCQFGIVVQFQAGAGFVLFRFVQPARNTMFDPELSTDCR